MNWGCFFKKWNKHLLECNRGLITSSLIMCANVCFFTFFRENACEMSSYLKKNVIKKMFKKKYPLFWFFSISTKFYMKVIQQPLSQKCPFKISRCNIYPSLQTFETEQKNQILYLLDTMYVYNYMCMMMRLLRTLPSP